MGSLTVPPDLKDAYAALAANLQAIFGTRLMTLVAFGPRIRSGANTRRSHGVTPGDALALLDRVTYDDLVACAPYADAWRRSGLQIPLVLGREEFVRSLDAFPLEYDDIIANHVPLLGQDPFAGIAVGPDDLRRACEARAKSHLVHLREGYLEARGRAEALAELTLVSAWALSALLGNIARLQGFPGESIADRASVVARFDRAAAAAITRVLALEADPILSADEAARLYPEYLAAVERLVVYVDGWTRR
jgi:hypothetical protein